MNFLNVKIERSGRQGKNYTESLIPLYMKEKLDSPSEHVKI